MRLIDWMLKFRKDEGLQPFVGKAIPDVPGPVVLSEWDEEPVNKFAGIPEGAHLGLTKRQTMTGWQQFAVIAGREAGRIRKGNAFSFSKSVTKSSVTVPEATFDQFVAAGIISEIGHVL